MLRRLNAFLVLGVSAVSVPALGADEDASRKGAADSSGSADAQASASAGAGVSATNGAVSVTTGGAAAAPGNAVAPSAVDPRPAEPTEGWHTEIHGKFRAPLGLGISSRPNPDKPDGPSNTQVSYAPNRTMDWSYYSFAYTRLQEQDWAELTFHEKKKHVDVAVGWMGYWLAASGFRNPDAAAIPGVASITLDTDVDVGGIKPNVALQMGAWWPQFGYFEKYDTFTLGRFRQVGEQLKLTVPITPDFNLTLTHGFGTGRDGSFNYGVATSNVLYAYKVGANLLTYANLQLAYKKYVDVGLHYNTEWTTDPYLTADASATDGKSYSDAAAAHLSVVGAEVNVRAPYAGHLWVSPSYISVKNGWALGAGTEVMHSLGGMGVASNYLGWTNSPKDSTGSGSMFNVGFLYENTLSSVMGKAPGAMMPEVTLNVFGLFTNASLELPSDSVLSQNSIKQFKAGADITVQPLTWLGVMLRYDTVNYDLDHPGYIFSAITPRLVFSSHFLSSESIYLQYSKYKYGDNMVLAGQWPWGTPLVAGTDVIQAGAYSGKMPDEDVFKIQASVAF